MIDRTCNVNKRARGMPLYSFMVEDRYIMDKQYFMLQQSSQHLSSIVKAFKVSSPCRQRLL